MKIKIHNVPQYAHEYLVTDTILEELSDGTIVQQYKLGINKKLIVSTSKKGLKTIEFNTGKKQIKLPASWFEIRV